MRRGSRDERGEAGEEARGVRAVHDAVVVGEVERRHGHRVPAGAVPDGDHLGLREAKDRDLGRVHDGREGSAADPAEVRDGHGGAAHLLGPDLARLRAGGEVRDLGRDGPQALAVGVPDHGDEEAVGRIDRDADMDVVLEDQRSPVRRERGVEARKLPEATGKRLDVEGERRELHAARGGLLAQAFAEAFDRAHVGAVVMGDLRDERVRCAEVCGRDAGHAGERFLAHGAVGGVVHVPVGARVRGGRAAAEVAVHVLPRDGGAPGGVCDLLDVDALLPGIGADGRACDHVGHVLTTPPRCTGSP